MSAETFWLLLTAACMIWYSTVTIYVAIRGAFDIKSMLSRLSGNRDRTGPVDECEGSASEPAAD